MKNHGALCTLFEPGKSQRVRCLACAHKCLLTNGKSGLCGVRKNEEGVLRLLVYNRPAALNIDPIEKKPLLHFLAGTKTFSFGTVGCNLRCAWCQNYTISQAAKSGKISGNKMAPQEIVKKALNSKCESISYTYNEPIVFAEFVHDTAELAKEAGLKNILVTNGYFSNESWNYLSDLIDAMNIDLKTISEKTCEQYCGCKLKPILDTIRKAHKKGIHIEITTLVIPGINDSEAELERIAQFIASVHKDIPWHVTRFFPMYKMTKQEITPLDTLHLAAKVGRKYLKNVHIGNV